MKKIVMVLTITTFMIILTACASFGIVSDLAASVDEIDSTAETIYEEKTIQSENGKFSVTMPDTWKEMREEIGMDDADIAIGSEYKGAYMIALNEAQSDMTYTFEEWMDIVKSTTLDNLENSQASDPTEISVNGCPAMQCVITGTMDNMNIKYLATYINGEEYYGQILCWALESDYANSTDDFQHISQSVIGL